jgi:hypothetical protein
MVARHHQQRAGVGGGEAERDVDGLRAISLCCARSGTCAPNAAGDASVTCAVVTRPVDLPAARARSRSVGTGCSSSSTPMAPLKVRTPLANAVAPAAESVTASSGSAESVWTRPA